MSGMFDKIGDTSREQRYNPADGGGALKAALGNARERDQRLTAGSAGLLARSEHVLGEYDDYPGAPTLRGKAEMEGVFVVVMPPRVIPALTAYGKICSSRHPLAATPLQQSPYCAEWWVLPAGEWVAGQGAEEWEGGLWSR